MFDSSKLKPGKFKCRDGSTVNLKHGIGGDEGWLVSDEDNMAYCNKSERGSLVFPTSEVNHSKDIISEA